MPIKQIEPHTLEDIRAVVLVTKTADVNHRGEIISAPSVISESVEHQGYTCLRCKVNFRQWRLAQDHVQDMFHKEEREARQMLSGMPSVLKGGRKRNRVPIIPEEQILDVVRFARDILGVKISDSRARMVVVLLRNPTKIPPASQVQDRSLGMRIAAEYKEVKGSA